MKKAGLIVFFAILLAGCAPRGAFLPPVQGESTIAEMYLVTNRLSDGPFRFSEQAAPSLQRMRYEVTVPLSRTTGEIAYATRARDRFGIAAASEYDTAAEFYQTLGKSGAKDDAIGVFVHGFNTNVPEALYRHTQIAADFGRLGPQITFAWPSAGSPTGYLADRDAANASRDALAGFLVELAQAQDRPMVLVAHSMGAYLAMEALRQLALSKQDITPQLAAVVLISPDIDIEVFRTQFERLSPKPDPFLVLASRSDRALRLSSRLSGESERLGSPDDFDQLRGMGIVVLDFSDVRGGDPSGHFSAVTSPEAIAMLQGLMASELISLER